MVDTDTTGIRRRAALEGIAWCIVFVVLDALQAVYLGAYLQRIDSFLLGFLVFGCAAVICAVWVAIFDRAQIPRACAARGPIVGLNLAVAAAWLAYFAAVQRIEPAIAFTMFSGAIPLVTALAGHMGFAEGQKPRNALERVGLLVVGAALLGLSIITVAGASGFVRGGTPDAVWGCIAALVAGVAISVMLLYGQRLHGLGISPVAQFALRFPLYLILTLALYLAGAEQKPLVSEGALVTAVVIGLLLLAFPIYAVQKVISLTDALTIGAFAAAAPMLILVLQFLEGRVAFSLHTLSGLLIYSFGSLLGLLGALEAAASRSGREAAGPDQGDGTSAGGGLPARAP